MKYINKILLLTCAVAAPFASCDTDTLQNLNINPQALNEVNMNFLFSAAQLSTSDGNVESNRYLNWRTNIGYCAYWMQHLATTGTATTSTGDKYFENVEADNAPWEYIYGGALKNLDEVIKQTSEGGFEEGRRKNTREAARILKAFLFNRLTDFYGNIPYTDALKGIDEGVFLPTYSTQQEIYADLLKELKEAGDAISASNPDDGFAASDMFFKGDVDKWKRWANSIRLRMAMRMSNVDAATAASVVTDALSGAGVMQSNADNVWIPMAEAPSQWTNQNGISRTFLAGDGGQTRVMSKTLIDVLKGPNTGSTADDDPRLMILSGGLNGNVDPLIQAGMPNGLDAGTLDAYTGITSSNPNDLFSLINNKLLDLADPYLVMSYSEVEFLQAEAKERNIGTVPGTALAHYEAGVKGAMQMYTPYDASLTVSDGAVAAYLIEHPYTPGAGGLAMIGTQMWISKFMNWWDAWNDYRRSGLPALVEINYPGNITGGKIPSRLIYPTHEVAVNSANMEAGGNTPNRPTTKVWWDNN